MSADPARIRVAGPVDLIYPLSAARFTGWAPGTVPVPITPMEFDVQACPFADGFGRALSVLVGRTVRVAVRARHGTLYTRVASGGGAQAGYREWAPLDFSKVWGRRVRPATTRQAVFFAEADAMVPQDMAGLLHQVVGRMTAVTFDHHTLVLPARVAIAQYAQYAAEQGITASRLEALEMLAGHPNATTQMAARLWENRTSTGPLPPLAQEGDGYGLACPGWLEDPHVPGLLAEMYRRCDLGRHPRALLAISSRRRRDLESVTETRLRHRPVAVRERFGELRARAAWAARLTEGHAPLMHARLTYELRRLVIRMGERLVELGLLNEPQDLLFLRITNLEHLPSQDLREAVEQRQADCDALDSPATPEPMHDAAEDPLGSAPVARLIRQVFGSSPPPDPEQGFTSGRSGAGGRARGPVRRVVRQVDLARVEPGDVVVAAEGGAAWSYAAPAASAFVSMTGSAFGHLAALARDYGLPCVVGLGVAPELSDGQIVEVDGDAGTVTVIGNSEGPDRGSP
jgi:phosphohistidine swiveling domain-containing protein